MSYKIAEHADGKYIEIELSGKLSKEAYQEFLPETEAKIKKFGKVRILVVLRDFHGWDTSGASKDKKFDLKHHGEIERLAIVGDTKWEKGMAVFCRPFTSAKIKFFDQTELATAEAWLHQDD